MKATIANGKLYLYFDALSHSFTKVRKWLEKHRIVASTIYVDGEHRVAVCKL